MTSARFQNTISFPKIYMRNSSPIISAVAYLRRRQISPVVFCLYAIIITLFVYQDIWRCCRFSFPAHIRISWAANIYEFRAREDITLAFGDVVYSCADI